MKKFWMVAFIVFVGFWSFAFFKGVNAQQKHIDKQGNETIIHEDEGYKFCFFERKVNILTEDNMDIKEESEAEFVHRVNAFIKENLIYDLTFTRTKAVMTFEIYVVTKRYMDVDWVFNSEGELIRALAYGWAEMKRIPEEIKEKYLK